LQTHSGEEKATLAERASSEQIVLAPEERRPAVIDAIRSAGRRVALSMFRCTDFEVMDALAEALSRNVQVELLLTQRAKGWEKKIRDLGLYLESMGARVYRYSLPRVKYHAKYLVVDEEMALVGSFNYTRKCFQNTCDFLLVTRDEGMVSGLMRLFEHDIRTPDLPLPRDVTDRLIIGPEWARGQFLKLLESARSSIRIIDHRISDSELIEALRERHAAGADVQIYGKGCMPGLKSHGKMMVIDGKLAVIGSISLSPPSLGARREVAAIIEDRRCVSALEDYLKDAKKPVRPGALTSSMTTAPAEEEEEDEEE